MPPGGHKNNPFKKAASRGVWRHFLGTHPEYLAKHYWWAYLWRTGVWFFDHQPIINAILFGHYQRLKRRAIQACMNNRPAHKYAKTLRQTDEFHYFSGFYRVCVYEVAVVDET